MNAREQLLAEVSPGYTVRYALFYEDGCEKILRSEPQDDNFVFTWNRPRAAGRYYNKHDPGKLFELRAGVR